MPDTKKTKKPKQVGGEVGEVRANIDVESLNAYLKRSVPAVCAPVAVKQFKVRLTGTCMASTY